jgi:HD-GYP domain-containing protein (c-di-GMP phosphodiesterase class II)
MAKETITEKSILIQEIRQKFRQLKAIVGFIVITLLLVIVRYLYEPISRYMDFLPIMSVSLILIIVLVLTLLGFYMLEMVSRKIISNIEQYSQRLDNVLKITRDMREEIFGDVLLDKIMTYSLFMTSSDAGAILLMERGNLVFKIVTGERADEMKGKEISKDQGIAGWVASNAAALRIGDVNIDDRFRADVDDLTGSNARSVLCIPLITKTGVVGVLELLHKDVNFYTEKDAEIISYLADQAAISLTRAQFFEDQKNYEIHLTDILLDAIDHHIPEKMGHAKRVARYSTIIANAIHMSEKDKKNLYFACLLHDVGFLKIRSDMHYKPEEYKKHSTIGYEMIKPISFYADIAPFILHHHERYDGKGYPEGLQGESIPFEARIIAITDAFDSMVSKTSYKIQLDFESAVAELKKNSGTQFDPQLVKVFVKNISPEHLL